MEKVKRKKLKKNRDRYIDKKNKIGSLKITA